MTDELCTSMGIALNVVGRMTKIVWETSTVIPFNDVTRQNECSAVLAKKLGYNGDVFFEAGTFAHIRDSGQQLGIHCDFLNDGTPGYDKTGVLSFLTPKVNGGYERLSVVGYT